MTLIFDLSAVHKSSASSILLNAAFSARTYCITLVFTYSCDCELSQLHSKMSGSAEPVTQLESFLEFHSRIYGHLIHTSFAILATSIQNLTSTFSHNTGRSSSLSKQVYNVYKLNTHTDQARKLRQHLKMPIHVCFRRAILTRKPGHTDLVFGGQSGFISRSMHARLKVRVLQLQFVPPWLTSRHTDSI